MSDTLSKKQITAEAVAQSQQSRNVERRRAGGAGPLRRLMSTELFSAVLVCLRSLLVHS